GHDAGKRANAGLGSAIGGIAGIAEHRDDGAIEDDRGIVVEVGQRRLHREEHRGEIGADDLLEHLARGSPERRGAGDAGIDEQDVVLAELPGTLPRSRAPRGIAASSAAPSLTSAVSASAFGPSSFAAASSVSRLRPVITTLAPSATNRRAVANPMPLLPPVTNAVLFFSLMSAS